MNNIEANQKYLPLMDEVYKQDCKTAILDGDSDLVKMDGTNEIKVAKIDMDALGDFDRNSGYTKGSTKLTWESIKYDKERSQDLRIDRLDNAESLDKPFAKLSSEFLRTKVIPETDAARIAKLAGVSGISKKDEVISDGAGMISALRACANKMDEDEVSEESRILFITPTNHAIIEDLDTTKSKEVLARFSQIIKVPQTRMYTAIKLESGKEANGTTKYGFKKAVDEYAKTTDEALKDGKTYYTLSGSTYTEVASPNVSNIATYYEKIAVAGHNINFLCVEKSAVITAMNQYIKYFTPDQDQDGDDNVFKYRNNNLYGYVFENKVAGVYLSYNSNK